MSSRVVVSRLGKVGAVLRCKHRPCVWALTAVWNRGYSQGRNITGPADLAHKQSTAMNAPWTGKNIYAEKVAPVTAKIIAPLRTWLSEAAGEWAKNTHTLHFGGEQIMRPALVSSRASKVIIVTSFCKL